MTLTTKMIAEKSHTDTFGTMSNKTMTIEKAVNSRIILKWLMSVKLRYRPK